MTTGKATDLTGMRFGRLTAIKRVGTKHGKALWLCKCDCGGQKETISTNLLRGQTTSCGCKVVENVRSISCKHGESHTSRLYNIWAGMKKRCYSPNNHKYKDYGARGIKMCNEWLKDYTVFRDWAMANGYTDGTTIDRIDNNGNYEPGNCRWITVAEQQKNRRNTRLYIMNGQLLTIPELARLKGMSPAVIRQNLRKGKRIQEICGSDVVEEYKPCK